MHPVDLNIFTAFFAGVASFLAPCTFATIPIYLSYISGVTRIEFINKPVKKVFITSLFYSFGFILFFSLLGLGLNFLGGFLVVNKDFWRTIGGILIIIFGVYMLFFEKLKINFLMGEKKFQLKRLSDTGPLLYFGAFIIGFVNAFAWSPCIGPIYGQIVALSLSSSNTWAGFYYSIVYALGLMIPFIIIALLFESSGKIVKRLSKYSGIIYKITAVIFIILGVMITTNTFNTLIVSHITNLFNNFGFDETKLPI